MQRNQTPESEVPESPAGVLADGTPTAAGVLEEGRGDLIRKGALAVASAAVSGFFRGVAQDIWEWIND
ncbi:hypothetical protein [Streptomyces collinus]|uniref:hypothetical protein n=1 Tax=Streptomyces collinus TaxID=42684 RepID=UPI003430FEC6